MTTLTGSAAERAEAIAQRCTQAKQHGKGWQARCPAHDDHTPSLSITPAGDKVLLKCFAKCGTEAVVAALGLTLEDLFPHPISRKSPRLAYAHAKRNLSQPIDIVNHSHSISRISRISRGGVSCAGERRWHEAQPIVPADPVWRYLSARGIEPSGALEALRYHPRLAYLHEDGRWTHHPAMVAAVSALDGTMVSVHRTYLDLSGQKADVPSPKKLMAPVRAGALRGAAVQLFPAGDILALAEGIETALAVACLSGWPTWSCISAAGLRHVQIPATITTVYICADRDPVGIEAAYLFARSQAYHRTVKVLVPPCPRDDWNDVLQREGA